MYIIDYHCGHRAPLKYLQEWNVLDKDSFWAPINIINKAELMITDGITGITHKSSTLRQILAKSTSLVAESVVLLGKHLQPRIGWDSPVTIPI